MLDRAFTTLALLSEDFEGGETTFPELGKALSRATAAGGGGGGFGGLDVNPSFAVRVRAGDLLVWANVGSSRTQQAAFEDVDDPFGLPGPMHRAYRCSKLMTHSSNPIKPRHGFRDGGGGDGGRGREYRDEGQKGENDDGADNGSPGGSLSGHKLAWQRWYAMVEQPFASERRAWTFEVPTRAPFQPILGCDSIGHAAHQHLHEIPPGEPSTSCRFYSEWPYKDGSD